LNKKYRFLQIILDVVNVHLPFVSELESTFAVFLTKGICFVDFSVLWQFAIGFYYKNYSMI